MASRRHYTYMWRTLEVGCGREVWRASYHSWQPTLLGLVGRVSWRCTRTETARSDHIGRGPRKTAGCCSLIESDPPFPAGPFRTDRNPGSGTHSPSLFSVFVLFFKFSFVVVDNSRLIYLFIEINSGFSSSWQGFVVQSRKFFVKCVSQIRLFA